MHWYLNIPAQPNQALNLTEPLKQAFYIPAQPKQALNLTNQSTQVLYLTLDLISPLTKW